MSKRLVNITVTMAEVMVGDFIVDQRHPSLFGLQVLEVEPWQTSDKINLWLQAHAGIFGQRDRKIDVLRVDGLSPQDVSELALDYPWRKEAKDA